MIPTTLVLIGPAELLTGAAARAARWLPMVVDPSAPHLCLSAPAPTGAGGPPCAVQVHQWSAVGEGAPLRPSSFAATASSATASSVTTSPATASAETPRPWLALSGSWLPPELSAAQLRGVDAAGQRSAVVGALLARAVSGRLWPLPADLHGQGTLIWCTADGAVHGTCDRHGGGLLYYGRGDGGVLAVANRASLVAAAISAAPRPARQEAELLWPLTRMGAPLGGETVFSGVQLLPQGARLTLHRGRCQVTPAPQLLPQRHDFDALLADLVRRPLALDTLLDHEVEVMLSGGKDIRLVLAALAGAERLDRVSRAVMWAPEGDTDLAVARLLGARLGFEVEVRPSPVSRGPWREGFLRHAFLTEGMVHAWDRKGSATVADVVTLNGYFGELYKSHVQRSFVLGPLAWRRFYGRRAWFDRHQLLTPPARAYLRRRFEAWLAAREAEGHPWHLLHDRWHREARMQRWVGHILQAEACATPWLQLLPGTPLLERYLAGPLRDRTQHRLHFELLRRIDPELLEVPLAEDRWARGLDPRWSAPKPQVRTGSAVGAQAQLWANHGAEMAAWLREGMAAGLAAWIEPKALEAMLTRCLAKPPSRLDLVGLMALLGIRAAFAEPEVLPMRVTTP